jgi:hypothetical protein
MGLVDELVLELRRLDQADSHREPARAGQASS